MNGRLLKLAFKAGLTAMAVAVISISEVSSGAALESEVTFNLTSHFVVDSGSNEFWDDYDENGANLTVNYPDGSKSLDLIAYDLSETSVSFTVQDKKPFEISLKKTSPMADVADVTSWIKFTPPSWAVRAEVSTNSKTYVMRSYECQGWLPEKSAHFIYNWNTGAEDEVEVDADFTAFDGRQNDTMKIEIKFFSDESCEECKSCAGSPKDRSSPEMSKNNQSGAIGLSAPLPVGSNCCSDHPVNVTWTTDSPAMATGLGTIDVRRVDYQGSNSIRIPADFDQPLQQLKMGDVIGVVYKENATSPLKWRLYDANGIGARQGGGTGPFPLTKADGAPLALLEELTVSEASGAVHLEHTKGNATVGSYTMTYNPTTNSWEKEDLSSATKEKLSVTASGSGWIETKEHYVKNPDNTWTLVGSSGQKTELIGQLEVVTENYESGDLVSSNGYYPDGRLKWTLNEDGSWIFCEYLLVGQIVYRPYGDTPHPWNFSGDWTPVGLTGIQSEVRTIGGVSRYIEGHCVSSVTHTYDLSGETNYTETLVENDGIFESRTVMSKSILDLGVLAGRALLRNDGRGIVNAIQYTSGHMVAETVGSGTRNVFHAAVGGDCLRQITTRGPVADTPVLPSCEAANFASLDTVGAVVANAETRDVQITDSKGRSVYSATEVLIAGAYQEATWVDREYVENIEGDSVVTESRCGRIVSVISKMADGSSQTSTDESGTSTTTYFDAQGRTASVVRPADGGGSITQTYVYNGLTTTITTTGAGGLGLGTSETRDVRGRVLYSFDETGAKTTYPVSPDGGLTTEIIHPGDVSEITTHYLDGRFKERSGAGVIREYASYWVATVNSSVFQFEKRSTGPAAPGEAHSVRWVETATDSLGRTVSVRRPGPPAANGGSQTDIVESYTYDAVTAKLSSVKSSANSYYRILEENLMGNISATGTALDTIGVLGADSSDRYSTTVRSFESRAGGYIWEIIKKTTETGGAAIVNSTASRMWTGDGEASESTDAANITTARTTTYNTATKTVVTSTTNPLKGTTTETTINGFLKTRSIPEATQVETFAYDGLGREIRHTDVRNATTLTVYNNLGQMDKVVDHLGQSVTYSYYPASHQSAGRVHTQTNSAGKVTETIYDLVGRVSSTGGNAAYPVSFTYDSFGDKETLTTYGTQTAVTTWVNDPPTGLLLEKKYHGQATGVKYTYRADGRRESRTWRRGAKTDYGYNTFGDLDTIDHPAGTPDVSFSNFDRLGRPGTVTEGGNVTSLAYDPQTGEISTTYAAGHDVLPGLSIVRKTPNLGRPGGYTLKQGSAAVEDVAYGYDNFGRLGGLASGGLEIGYQYYPGTSILRETTHSQAGSIPRVETRHVDLAGRLTGIITTVPNGTGRRTAASAGYLINNRGLREKLTREDGTSWNFGYNDRSEVTSGLKKLANGSLAAGLQFGYQYDGIGNREWAKSGGDSLGLNQRTVNYTRNALNQYSSITTPGSFDVLVRSPSAVGIAVNGTPVFVANQGVFYRAQATATNTNGAWVGLDTTSPPGSAPHVTGHRWIAPSSFSPQYDDDGNLLDDGRWANTWDAENRLITQTTTAVAAAAGVPRCKIENTYDWQSRRIQKKVSTSTNGTTWTLSSDARFVYDGWNQLAFFAASGGTLSAKQTNLWGLDLSGRVQGAGGVSGLVAVNTVSPQSVCYPAYDGNGNIIAWTATNGDTLQRIDYDPFGNVVSREGVSGFEAPAWGFSTKYEEKETGLLYYGFRYYDPVTGRWPSRDPIEESGGTDLYCFVKNNQISNIDWLGLYNISDVKKRMIANYGEKISFALDQMGKYGHKFEIGNVTMGDFEGGYRMAKIDCDARNIDSAADWGMNAMREWAFYGRKNGDYFSAISRKWVQFGPHRGDTGKVLGQELDWLHAFSSHTSSNPTLFMYDKDSVPGIYLWVFTNMDGLIAGGGLTISVPIIGSGLSGPNGLHSDYVDDTIKSADQTHHFAAFFYADAGLFADTLSDLSGDEFNPHDKNLARVASDYRSLYSNTPDYYGAKIEAELKSPSK